MSYASIDITNSDRVRFGTAFADSLQAALNDAIADASNVVSANMPDLFLRDCLGGLRAEVRWRDGKIIVVRT